MECPQCCSSCDSNWKVCPSCAHVLLADRECEFCSAGMMTGWKACPACGREALVAPPPAQNETKISPPAPARPAKRRRGGLRKGQFELGEQWENSLGMKFVKVPRSEALFGIWATRVRDYELFAEETERELTQPSFEQGPSHPAVYVSWEDAQEFCRWLTAKELETGVLEPGFAYRLPSDLEWSCAVGLPAEGGHTPKSRDEQIPDHYPWGSEWPPPKRAGNYDQDLKVDRHTHTSPVGNFKANRFGLYDLGGNVWEWCEDWYDDEQSARVLRGASWSNYGQGILLSSCRRNCAPDFRNDYIGFRCVLADVPLQER